jgi:hypothetical protein
VIVLIVLLKLLIGLIEFIIHLNDVVPNSLLNEGEEYMCNICGHTFSTAQSLAAHIDSEYPEAEQPEIF